MLGSATSMCKPGYILSYILDSVASCNLTFDDLVETFNGEENQVKNWKKEDDDEENNPSDSMSYSCQ